MSDKIAGHLEVGTNGKGEVVINHPKIEVDAQGVGHLIFSPRQAFGLADVLRAKAYEAMREEVEPGHMIETTAESLSEEMNKMPPHCIEHVAYQTGVQLYDLPERRSLWVKPIVEHMRRGGQVGLKRLEEIIRKTNSFFKRD